MFCEYFIILFYLRNELQVHSEIVPLQQALRIRGLRAVFGEVYPDPVRVISVGPKVSTANAVYLFLLIVAC